MGYTNHPVDLALRNPGHKIALGSVAFTSTLVHELGGAAQAVDIVAPLLVRHAQGDWGDIGDDDKALNDQSLVDGVGRVMSVYLVELPAGEQLRLWIITNGDRSVTTAMLPEDY